MDLLGITWPGLFALRFVPVQPDISHGCHASDDDEPNIKRFHGHSQYPPRWRTLDWGLRSARAENGGSQLIRFWYKAYETAISTKKDNGLTLLSGLISNLDLN